MNTTVKITAFSAALAASFGAAYGVGSLVSPVAAGSEPAANSGHAEAAHSDHGSYADPPAGGLQVSEAGYTFDLKTPSLTAGSRSELRFAIRDRNGRQVTAYQREHDKELHLILASRDLVTYRHLHPVRAADGTWTTPVSLPDAGSYRVFADFAPAAKGTKNLTLGADLAASGPYKPAELPKPSRTVTVDGYTVTLSGSLLPGVSSKLELNVSMNGRPVTDLQPYLGAYGHLVALRAGDLAYLHVHPNGEPGDGATKPGPGISFTASAPSTGTYRLFLDFQHNGTVRTAAFTVQTGTGGTPAPRETHAETDDHRH
ncbi:hypothetical protein ABZ946_34885 [Streptomyces sp. NPDC046324]|uniref:hypothetical protein n=1 Tax=Streptomyces sp. NPDC046324 TaxID=3154915 RepID=UPI0033E3F28C